MSLPLKNDFKLSTQYFFNNSERPLRDIKELKMYHDQLLSLVPSTKIKHFDEVFFKNILIAQKPEEFPLKEEKSSIHILVTEKTDLIPAFTVEFTYDEGAIYLHSIRIA